jgi:hypothetical protein
MLKYDTAVYFQAIIKFFIVVIYFKWMLCCIENTILSDLRFN